MSTNWKLKQSVMAAALKEAADTLEREANELRAQADAENWAYQWARKRRDMPGAIKLYMEKLATGSDHATALQEAARKILLAGIHIARRDFYEFLNRPNSEKRR